VNVPTDKIPPAHQAASKLPGFVNLSKKPICAHCVKPDADFFDQHDYWWVVAAGGGFLFICFFFALYLRRRCAAGGTYTVDPAGKAEKAENGHHHHHHHHDHHPKSRPSHLVHMVSQQGELANGANGHFTAVVQPDDDGVSVSSAEFEDDAFHFHHEPKTCASKCAIM
jgi:hypothetical protein